jgi:hypothetical protein
MATMSGTPVDHAPFELLPHADPQQVREAVMRRLTPQDGSPGESSPIRIVGSLVDEIVPSKDERWRRTLSIEAVIGWPEEAVLMAAEMVADRSVLRRIAGAELFNNLCRYLPERNLEFAQTIAEAVDDETDPDALSFLTVALSCAAEYEGYAAPETAPSESSGVWTPLSPDDQGLMDRHEVWQLVADERLDRILALKDAKRVSSRRRLAVALGSFDLTNRLIRAALLALTADPADEVRDWATFTVVRAYPRLDGDDVRAALWARAADTDWEVRDQAIAALAHRRAEGAIDLLGRALREAPSDYLLKAAGDLASPMLLAAVMSITKDRDCPWFVRAIQACGGTVAETPAG